MKHSHRRRTLRAARWLTLTLLGLPRLALAQPEPPVDAERRPLAAPEAPQAAPPEAPQAAPREAPQAAPTKAPTRLQLELADGTSMRFGLLWHAQYETLGNSVNSDVSQNLFLRRFALIVGGTVLHDLEYFFDSDFGNLFKASGEESLKNGPGFVTKDAFVTFKGLGQALMIDGGLMMPPGARNSLLAGPGLLSLDFFRNAFVHNTVFGNTSNPFGRDLGVQLRGHLGNGLISYRLGVFQGKRGAPSAGPPVRAGSRNSFRFAGRVQLNLLDAEPNYFLFATYLGKKRILSFGAAADYQGEDERSYRALALDGAFDLPLGSFGGITGEVDWVYRDGGTLVALPEQTALQADAGLRIDALRLSPVARFERRWVRNAPGDETVLGAGLAFWAYGHTSNLKVFYQRIRPESPARAFNQLNIQWQLAFF